MDSFCWSLVNDRRNSVRRSAISRLKCLCGESLGAGGSHALSPAVAAIACDVPPVTQPPRLKPTTIVATTAPMHAQTSMVFEG